MDAQAAAFAAWRARQDSDCTCRPVYNTARGELEFDEAARRGCPLHCTHYGIPRSATSWRCSCGESYQAPCTHERVQEWGGGWILLGEKKEWRSANWRCLDCGASSADRR